MKLKIEASISTYGPKRLDEMEIRETCNIQFNLTESIKASTLVSANEMILLLSSGDVIRYNINREEEEHLFSVESIVTYDDGGFDVNAKSTFYTLDNIVVLVNDYKQHGFVHFPGRFEKLHLWRGDYNVSVSRFPISLFKDHEGAPHLIYAEAWNHLQIMNLESRQILTASKSLIEEYAEEIHLEFYKKHQEENKLPWPRPYDYFFGRLEMSPDKKQFLSAGWAWGSYDSFTVYEVNHFINSNRISALNLGGWEHSNRAVCWIDSQTIAVAYDPIEEGDEDATENSAHELHIYKIETKKGRLIRKIKVEGINLVQSEIQYDETLNSLVLCFDSEGVAIVSLDGVVLFHDKEFKVDTYNAALNLFVRVDSKSVRLYEMGFAKTYALG